MKWTFQSSCFVSPPWVPSFWHHMTSLVVLLTEVLLLLLLLLTTTTTTTAAKVIMINYNNMQKSIGRAAQKFYVHAEYVKQWFPTCGPHSPLHRTQYYALWSKTQNGCFWLKEFWSNAFDTLNSALNIDLGLNPLTALFGSISFSMSDLAWLLPLPLLWLDEEHIIPPSYDMWIQKIFCCIKLEKIRFSLSGSLKSCHETWRPVLDRIKYQFDLFIRPHQRFSTVLSANTQ